jgi:KDO2-lipid IV(A) lauroyltransferase
LAPSPICWPSALSFRNLRYLVEYLLARCILLLLDLTPLPVTYWIARRLADLWYACGVRRRRVARANILQCGIAGDARSASVVARRSFQHFAMVIIESLKSAKYLEGDAWKKHISLEIDPEVQAVLDDPASGLILVSGHYGNWEIAAQLLSMFKPVAGITREMSNPMVERLVARRKPRYRFRLEPKYSADPTRFISILREGSVLALLYDQFARDRAMMVEFFGRPAATHTTAAMLHLVTKSPLCFAWCRRIAPMTFVLETSALIRQPPSGDKQSDVRAILERFNRELERIIREAPEQYLWSHRRWRD